MKAPPYLQFDHRAYRTKTRSPVDSTGAQRFATATRLSRVTAVDNKLADRRVAGIIHKVGDCDRSIHGLPRPFPFITPCSRPARLRSSVARLTCDQPTREGNAWESGV